MNGNRFHPPRIAVSTSVHVREDAPGALERTAYSRALDAVRAEVGERAAAVVELARELGLRSKEASLIDARAALAEAQQRGAITVDAGTKGGREREVPITSETQVQALERAAQAQGGDRSMVPEGRAGRPGARASYATPARSCRSTRAAGCTTCGQATRASAMRR